MQLSGIVFIAGESMVAGDEGANFGPELSVMASALKTRFNSGDVPFIYSVPSKELAPKLTQPKSIKGKSKAVEINDWYGTATVEKLIDTVVK